MAVKQVQDARAPTRIHRASILRLWALCWFAMVSASSLSAWAQPPHGPTPSLPVAATATSTADPESFADQKTFHFALKQLSTGQYRRASARLLRLGPRLKLSERRAAAEALRRYADDLERLSPSAGLSFRSQPAGTKQVIGLMSLLGVSTVGSVAADLGGEAGAGSVLAILGGLGGFYAGLRLTERAHIPDAQASMMIYGSVLSAASLAMAKTSYNASVYNLGAVAGAAGGWWVARSIQVSPGQSSYLSLLTLMSLGSAVALQEGLSLNDTVNYPLWGTWAGAAIGFATVNWIDWSASRVRYVALGGALGSLLGLASQAFFSFATDNKLILSAAAGAWVGAGVAVMLTAGLPESPYVQDPGPRTSVGPSALLDSDGRSAPGLSVSGRF